MQIIRHVKQMRDWSTQQRMAGHTIGFVPTMGYLHEGHLELMRESNRHAEKLVVSIFVNPAQFNDPSDLEKYPRDEEGDLQKCRDEGCEVVYYPSAEEMYPPGYASYVQLKDLERELCGTTRPGHFRGVATVVTKLFNVVQPTHTVFGAKDFQQLAIIRRMVRDLDFDIEVIGFPTVREADGLAMSSRNARLSEDDRRRAVVISQALFAAKDAVQAGERDVEKLIAEVSEKIQQAGSGKIDYVQIVSTDDLNALVQLDRPAVMAVAAHFGPVRLIDNVLLYEG